MEYYQPRVKFPLQQALLYQVNSHVGVDDKFKLGNFTTRQSKTNPSKNLFREQEDVVLIKEANFATIDHIQSNDLNSSFKKLTICD